MLPFLQIRLREKGIMLFVGREKETKAVIRALEDGKNVILKGHYGIGRTALARHVAEVIGERWVFHFIDFSRTPGEMCQTLALGFKKKSKGKKRRKPMSYKSERYRILHGDIGDEKRHVIVFDNAAKLTRAKVSMLRRFAEEQRFQTITIVECFIKEGEEVLLRALMAPSVVVAIGYLNRAETWLLVRGLVAKKHLSWDEQRIRTHADSTGGYPLGIVDYLRGRGNGR